jgi:hypothetical protein
VLKGGAVAYQSGSVIFGDTCKNVLLFAKIDYNIYSIIWGDK